MDVRVQEETGMRLFSCLKKHHLTLNPFGMCVYIHIFLTEVKQFVPIMPSHIVYFENSRL